MARAMGYFLPPLRGSTRASGAPGLETCGRRSGARQARPPVRRSTGASVAAPWGSPGRIPAMRNDGRADDQLRPIKITRNFTSTPAGSVLWEQGRTIVLVTASVTQELPPFFKETRPGGWVTAEYVMLPGSTPQRKGWP